MLFWPARLTAAAFLISTLTTPLATASFASSEQVNVATDVTEMNNRGVKEAQAGRFEQAAEWLRRALRLDSSDLTARKNLSGVLTDWASQKEKQADPDEAVNLLKEAVTLFPENGLALAELGDILYLRRNDLDGAVLAWQKAHGHMPVAAMDQVLVERIAKAQRDALIERGFLAQQTEHFAIRFQEKQAVATKDLSKILEESYARLLQLMGQGPSQLTVMVYTARDLHRVSTQRDWAVGFYDGRIRLQLDELSQPFLPDLVIHELTHAFLQHQYGFSLPMWVHEGFAQLQEQVHPHSPEAAALIQKIQSRESWVPLEYLDKRFSQPSNSEDVFRAYAQSRIAVSELIEKYGAGSFLHFLLRLSQGKPIAEAYDESFAPSRWVRANQGIFE